MSAGEVLSVFAGIPPAPLGTNGAIVWKVDHTCDARSTVDIATGALKDIPAPCAITCYYVPLPIIEVATVEQQASGAEAPLASVPITLTDEMNAVLASGRTDAAGRLAFRVSEAQARPRLGQATWRLFAATQVASQTRAAVEAGNAATALAVNELAIRPIVSSSGNTFIYGGQPTPPAPPTAAGDLYLNIHSTYDPQRGVYRSTTQEISWPQGEVLDFTPFVQLAPLPVAPPGWQYRQTVVAWSLVSTTVNGKERAAAAQDDRQRSGCRQRAEPPDNPAADLSGLLGCRYRYLDAPTSADMAS